MALQLGEQPLELFEPAHHVVVLVVADQQGVALVVRLAQFEDAGGQGVRLLFRRCETRPGVFGKLPRCLARTLPRKLPGIRSRSTSRHSITLFPASDASRPMVRSEDKAVRGARIVGHMATFTFGAGNARKLLRLPLYGLGAIAALLVPRSGRRWAFGSGVGLGEGALPLYHAARERLGEETRLVWLASSDAELAAARAAGLDAEAKHSVRGWWTTLRSRVLVVTHGFGDVNRYATSGGFTVQLWHGIPLKKLHLDTPAALRVRFLPDHRLVRAVMARGHRLASRGIGVFPAASELVAPRIASAFGIPLSRVVVTGDPRDDVLYAGTPEERQATGLARIADAIGPIGDDRLVLYAPTWRDGAADPGAPTLEEWDAIAAWLERSKSVLLVRTHPLGLGDYAAGTARSTRVRMLGPDRLADITEVLPAIDLLVTDYSSIAYDFALTDGPILFFAPDIEQYARRRGLYENYRIFSGGRYVTSWANVLEELDGVTPGSAFGDELTAHTRWLRDEHFDHTTGGATERVLDHILDVVSPENSGERGADSPKSGLARSESPEKRDRTRVAEVTFEAEPPALRVSLRADAGSEITGVRLDGARAFAVGALDPDAGGQLTARFPLLTTRWGANGLALPSGDYRVTLDGVIPTSRLSVDAALPEILLAELFHATVHAESGGLVVRITPPLAEDERGPRAQKALERDYRRSRPTPERAVFLESFYGQSAACNPLGIDRALLALRPDVTRYWSVVDGSVAIPEGGIRIIEGSRDWWRVRASARVLVINDWLRKRYRRRTHQHVLQTWHGTMLKRLALDRSDRGWRSRIAIRREDKRWDALLAQNSYSARIFRSAYGHRGPIWEEGYPRNDQFDQPGRAAEIRTALGIPDGIRVVLYAPTWRDDRTEMVDYVDLTSFVSELGDDHVLLVRGHSRTLRYGRDLRGRGLDRCHELPRYGRPAADRRRARDRLLVGHVRLHRDRTPGGVLHAGPCALQPGPARVLLRPARRGTRSGRAHPRRVARRDPRGRGRPARLCEPRRSLARAVHPVGRRLIRCARRRVAGEQRLALARTPYARCRPHHGRRA